VIKKLFVFVLSLVIVSQVFGENNRRHLEYRSSLSKLSVADRNLVYRINKYFEDISTIKSDFYQFNSVDQSSSEGTFKMARPGKFRFEYLSSPRSLFISSGGVTSYYDIELDEVSVLPVSKVPLVYLLSGQRGLEDLDSKILKVSCSEIGCTAVTEVMLDDVDYKVEYVFDTSIKNLVAINITIDDEQKISLKFVNTEINLALDNNVFIFRNPRVYRKRK
jgi:outer membrane lipoprotein-sorting protein